MIPGCGARNRLSGMVLVAVVLFSVLQLYELELMTESTSSGGANDRRPPTPAQVSDPNGNSVNDPNDWFDKEYWNSRKSGNTCLFVEDLCHSTHSWFYNPTNSSYQPHPFILELATGDFVNTLPKGYPKIVSIKRQIPTNLTCAYSPIANHLSFHARFNDMLGEFYTRLLLGLQSLVEDMQDPDAVAQHTQIYLHLQKGATRGILESHHLMLGTLFLNPVQRFQSLFDATRCQCMKRFIMCGYERKKTKKNLVVPAPAFGYGDTQVSHKSMRETLLKRLIEENPLMQEAVHARRKEILRKLKVGASVDIDESEWTIIGLAQRTGRRRWSNVNGIARFCREQFLEFKVACVHVNIEEEEWSNPVKHVVAHASLNALIGIHGAQLTEALFMPAGSLVVELLPWIHPDVEHGRWTNWVRHPTPLGGMYNGTDLEHIGYPLPGSSAAAYCRESNFSAECFDKQATHWDNRDFTVDTKIMNSIVEKFVLNRPKMCDEYIKTAADDYVLYNVNCLSGNKTHPTLYARHYYRHDKNWVVDKQRKSIPTL